MTEQVRETIATILIKAGRGQEEKLRAHLYELRKPGACMKGCSVGATVDGIAMKCDHVQVREAAYCFGPFDFFVIVQARDVGVIEDFVVHCLRAERDVVTDTQTLIGLRL